MANSIVLSINSTDVNTCRYVRLHFLIKNSYTTPAHLPHNSYCNLTPLLFIQPDTDVYLVPTKTAYRNQHAIETDNKHLLPHRLLLCVSLYKHSREEYPHLLLYTPIAW